VTTSPLSSNSKFKDSKIQLPVKSLMEIFILAPRIPIASILSARHALGLGPMSAPGPKTEVAPLQRLFRFTPGTGHGQRVNWSLAGRTGLKIPPLRFPTVRSLRRFLAAPFAHT